MLAVYVCIYYLFPKYYKKEKYFQFIIYSILILIVSAYSTSLTQKYYVAEVLVSYVPNRAGYDFIIFLSNFVDFGLNAFIFVFTFLIHYYYVLDKRHKQIEKDKVTSELDFLKAQINPHFLFNALNSIYVLMKVDVNLSEQILLKFSSLLRYQLYDCSNNNTSLEKEIQFIKDYIELEKIRSEDNLIVTFSGPDSFDNASIAPFILMPFVENAYKHISHFKDQSNFIRIKITLEKGILLFYIENTIENSNELKSYSTKGIGLQNVKRRLELLYPEKNSLTIDKSNLFYTVKLNLDLNED